MDSALVDMARLEVEVPEMYTKLASIGTKGAHPGNMHRDLVAVVDCRLPGGWNVDMPFIGKAPGTWNELKQQFLLPHELFAHLWAEKKQAFDEFFLDLVDNCKHSGRPWLRALT